MKFRLILGVVGATLLGGVCTAAELVTNGSFEAVKDGKTVGWSVGRHFRFEKGCGMNGTRGLAFENLDEKDFYEYPSQNVPFEPGKRYAYSVMVKTEGLTKNVNLCVEWYDAQGKWLSGSYQNGFAGTHDWSMLKGVTPPIPSDAAKVRIVVAILKGGLGKAWIDDLSMRPFERAVFGGLYTSAYRNLAADGMVRFQAAVNLKGHPGACVFFTYKDAALDMRRVPASKLSADSAVLVMDAAHLARGRHPVSCEVISADGQRLGGGSLDFERVAELPKRRTWIDGKGRTIVDGKPFFPLGIYLSAAPKDAADPLLTGPFNCVMPYNCSREGLDFCRAHGLEVIYPLNSCWSWYEKIRPKEVTTDAEADRWIENKVAEVKDHPAVMAWYCNDEISLEHYPQLLARQKLLERIDPGHPTWTVLYQFGEVRDYFPTFDVVGTDPYPVPHAPISTVAQWTRTTREESMGLKPMWQVPQAFSWGDFRNQKGDVRRFPTREEMVNMTWQCVANGANGIVYWCFRLLYQNGRFRVDRWADICAAANSVKPYIPVLLSEDEEPEVRGASETLSARAWRYQGSVYLAVVNNTREPVKGTLSVAETGGEALQCLQGSGGCALQSPGRVSVSLPGLGVSFLRLGKAWR